MNNQQIEHSKKQFKILEKIELPEQKSQEWYDMRNNMITASDTATAIGRNPYEKSIDGLIAKKIGFGKPFKGNSATYWGCKYEEVATRIYEHINKCTIIEFGCLQHPTYKYIGASPDGITPDGIMLEIKCPTSRKITGIPPEYYWCQMQQQLEVCDLYKCDFLECLLEEYKSKEEYFNDKTTEFKGCVIEFIGEEKPEFAYSVFHITQKKYQKWFDNEIKIAEKKKWKYKCHNFWKLTQISCVPIYRNKNWFNNTALPILTEVWNKILYYRKHIDEWKTEKNIKIKESDINDDYEFGVNTFLNITL